MKNKIIFIAMLLSALCFGGCHKHHDTKPAKPKCKISQISVGGTTYQITYNAAGKINTVSRSNNIVWSYTYTGNTVVQNGTNNGAFSWKATSNLNAAGLPTSTITIANQAGTEWTKVNYEYDGSLLSKVTYTSSSSSTPSVVGYTNDGNNIVSATLESGAIAAFDYYTNKPRQVGGFVYYHTVTYGGTGIGEPDVSFFHNKNLMKSITVHGATVNFSYDFDSDGKITSMTIAEQNGTPRLVQYQYECK